MAFHWLYSIPENAIKLQSLHLSLVTFEQEIQKQKWKVYHELGYIACSNSKFC